MTYLCEGEMLRLEGGCKYIGGLKVIQYCNQVVLFLGCTVLYVVCV